MVAEVFFSNINGEYGRIPEEPCQKTCPNVLLTTNRWQYDVFSCFVCCLFDHFGLDLHL